MIQGQDAVRLQVKPLYSSYSENKPHENSVLISYACEHKYDALLLQSMSRYERFSFQWVNRPDGTDHVVALQENIPSVSVQGSVDRLEIHVVDADYGFAQYLCNQV